MSGGDSIRESECLFYIEAICEIFKLQLNSTITHSIFTFYRNNAINSFRIKGI